MINSVNGQFTTLTARHTELHTLVDPLLKDLNTAVECSNAANQRSTLSIPTAV